MYTFNKIIVNPQLPKRIEKLSVIANNLWWSWNTNFLKLFKEIDIDLWERVGKNPVKFLKNVSQEKLEEACENQELLKQYDKFAKDGLYNLLGPNQPKPTFKSAAVEALVKQYPTKYSWLVYLGLFDLSNLELTRAEKKLTS